MSITELAKGRKYRVRVWGAMRPDGTRPRLSRTVLGTLRDAKRVERELLAERDKGTIVGPDPRLSDWIAEYIEDREREVAPKTVALWRYLAGLVVPRIGALRLSQVKPALLRRLYRELSEAGLSGTTVRKVHVFLGAVFRRAVLDELILRNPCQAVKAPALDTPEKRSLSDEEADALLERLEGSRLYLPALLALTAGLRRGEILALRWQDVDLEQGLLSVTGSLDAVTVKRKAPKTERGRRIVPIPPEVVAALKSHRREQAEIRLLLGDRYEDHDLVFPSFDLAHNQKAGRPWPPEAFTQAWRRAKPGCSFHELRHTYATRLLRAGVRDELVSRVLGHSSSVITRMVYSHTQPDELEVVREAVRGLTGNASKR